MINETDKKTTLAEDVYIFVLVDCLKFVSVNNGFNAFSIFIFFSRNNNFI